VGGHDGESPEQALATNLADAASYQDLTSYDGGPSFAPTAARVRQGLVRALGVPERRENDARRGGTGTTRKPAPIRNAAVGRSTRKDLLSGRSKVRILLGAPISGAAASPFTCIDAGRGISWCGNHWPRCPDTGDLRTLPDRCAKPARMVIARKPGPGLRDAAALRFGPRPPQGQSAAGRAVPAGRRAAGCESAGRTALADVTILRELLDYE
jgi:hypothetical protein